MGSSPCRSYSLLGIAHPVVGPLLGIGSVQGDGLTRGRDFEGNQDVALKNIFVNYIRTS